ncbi:hypothetical protein E2C01_006544 [Portunus trituberculatus]|uniref:Uncharacterized protein n=1 Tax=Portunus trituberculatus TaxID=210409 RepID=A0A5B7CVD0_PORTR|nr:hypothetical protein [Portunus trituberculatus]
MGAAAYKNSYRGKVVAAGRHVQRRGPSRICRVGIGSCIKQFHHAVHEAILRGRNEWRLVAHRGLAVVDWMTAPQQLAHFRHIASL